MHSLEIVELSDYQLEAICDILVEFSIFVRGFASLLAPVLV